MKSTLSTALLLLAEANPTADVLPPMAQPRRYRDLDSMIADLNPNFDPRKYWAYGCHCFALDDRPMSGMGKGKPVDELDALCKRYKDCQKCARRRYGEDCVGETTKYNWERLTSQEQIKCTDKRDSCQRATCECDRLFALEIERVKDAFNRDNHIFWSRTGFEPEERCIAQVQVCCS